MEENQVPKPLVPRNYTAWATLLTPLYTPLILESLISQGYAICSLAAQLNVGNSFAQNDIAPSSVLGLHLTTTDETAKDVLDRFIATFSILNVKAFSIVIASQGDIMDLAWFGSNFLFKDRTPMLEKSRSELN